MNLLSLYLDAGDTYIKEVFELSQLKENKQICIVKNKKEVHRALRHTFLYISNVLYYLFKAVATSTAQATVHPTIGLLPIPRNPIIST